VSNYIAKVSCHVPEYPTLNHIMSNVEKKNHVMSETYPCRYHNSKLSSQEASTFNSFSHLQFVGNLEGIEYSETYGVIMEEGLVCSKVEADSYVDGNIKSYHQMLVSLTRSSWSYLLLFHIFPSYLFNNTLFSYRRFQLKFLKPIENFVLTYKHKKSKHFKNI